MKCIQIACIYFRYVYRMTDNAWEQMDVQRGLTTIVAFLLSVIFLLIMICHSFSSFSFFFYTFS